MFLNEIWCAYLWYNEEEFFINVLLLFTFYALLRLPIMFLSNYFTPVNSPYKWPVTQKLYQFDDVIVYTGKINVGTRAVLQN